MKASVLRFAVAVTMAFALATTFALAQSDQAYEHRRAETHQGAPGRPLTGPSDASPVAVIAQYLRGLGRNVDVQSLVRESAGRSNSGTIRVEQRVGGVRLYGAYAKATLSERGELVHLIENLVATPGAVGRARVSEGDALAATLRYLYPDESIATGPGRRQGDTVRFERTAFFHQDPTVTRVVYPAADGSFGAGFVVTTWTEEKNLLHETLVGAGGEVLFDELRTNQDRYNAYSVSPLNGAQTVFRGPGAGNDESPSGWLFDEAQSSLDIAGNNVNAYLDTDNNNATDGGGEVTAGDFLAEADLTLQPADAANRNVAVQNLFYLNNLLHDTLYRHGFTEGVGNFQEDNFGNDGLGSDSVNAEAQDGGGTDNANFATPTDGSNPRMQMYLWNSNPDHEVVIGTTHYRALQAAFGPALSTTGVSGLLTVAPAPGDGCSALSGLSGRIAVIDRGTCDFAVKVQNAQSAGAVAVIVVNNTGGNDLLTMGGGKGNLRIPSVMVSQNDGPAIKAAAAQSATVKQLDGDPLQIDGDLDGDVVFHEYGHGLTWRMIGGMSGPLAGAIGEGAADVLAMLMTRTEDPDNYNVIGEYAALASNGIRRARYNDAYPNTYSDVTGGGVHSDGEIYAAAMRKVIELYILKHGVGDGLEKAFEVFIDGMNYTPATPAFEDMRDGMLQSPLASGDECLIWQGFAKFGIGVGASGTVRGKRVTIVESTAIPASCPAAPATP